MAEINVHFDLRLGPRVLRGGLAALMLLSAAAELGSENVTLTTYYPAPTGIYTQMITTGKTVLARDGSNVGIGTASPGAAYLLDVNGKIHAAGDVCTDAGGGACLSGGVPSGAVMYFDASVCPSGWSQFSSADGRYLVGLSQADASGHPGAVGARIGTALSYEESRPAGAHNHESDYITVWFNPVGTARWMTLPLHSGGTASNGWIGTGTDPATGAALKSGTNAPYVQLLVCRKL